MGWLGAINKKKNSQATELSQLKEELVSASRDRTEWAQVSINDSGPGISAGECQKIFEKFYQVSEDGGLKPKGTGRGLAISKAFKGRRS